MRKHQAREDMAEREVLGEVAQLFGGMRWAGPGPWVEVVGLGVLKKYGDALVEQGVQAPLVKDCLGFLEFAAVVAAVVAVTSYAPE